MAGWRICSILMRRKRLYSNILETPLHRCLTTFDLTILSLAQMIGAGIFVLTGTVSQSLAGPGVIISFLIAGMAAVLSALCYAEFGSLIPRTGSAYLFTYVMLGEAVAFIAGWSIISEQIIGAATVARGLSGAVDMFFDKWIRNKTLETFGRINVSWMSPYPDFLALVPIIIACGVVISGVKNTAVLNNVLTTIQIAVLGIIAIAGFTKADITNWTNPDRGGFLPYGFGGVITGAASCFFAFIGFDSLVLAGEEAENPRKSIPCALLFSMPIVCTLYILVASTLTLMQPYYNIDPIAPFPMAFEAVGMDWASYVVTVGSILALATALTTNIFAMPRILYAMAADGMLFPWVGSINGWTKMPVNAVFINAVCTGTLALFIDMEVLVELFSIGTLLSFTLVAIALIKFHYTPPDGSPLFQKPLTVDDRSQLLDASISDKTGTLRPIALTLKFLPLKFMSVDAILCAMVSCQVLFGAFVAVAYHNVGFGHWYVMLLLVVSGTFALCFFVMLAMHQTNQHDSGFRVPLSPLLETMCVSVNLLLMVMLKPLTWARLAIWLLIGGLVYVLYSVQHSKAKVAIPDITLTESDLERSSLEQPAEEEVDEEEVVDGSPMKCHGSGYGSIADTLGPSLETSQTIAVTSGSVDTS